METNPPHNIPGPDSAAIAVTAPPPPRKNSKTLAVVVLVIALVVVAAFVLLRRPAVERAGAHTAIVAVVKVTREDLATEVAIPAEFRAYTEVELHAKVSGYLDKISVDFGDKVKAGQLLATLEVPELRDQLHNAAAVREKMAADYTNTHVIAVRLQAVNREHPNLVAQQDLDTAAAKDSAALAALAAAQSETERFETLMKYTRITAPFDGVITRRYADPGTLIQAGTASDTQSRAVVRLSDNFHLRLDFPVSVDDVRFVRAGGPVRVRVDSLGGKTYTGTITRFTDRVNEDTRTMITEIELPNPGLELVPGMWASVLLELQRHPGALAVPITAVGGERHSTVYVVNEKGEIEERAIVTGLETPDKCEVLSGLKEGELVILGNRSLVHPGQKVETKAASQPTLP